jgi:light-regulated signal transduction histidine kinase (bacteriophytochrome)
VEHLLNVSIDITEQELAEQSLQQKNIELQQSNASLEEYAYVASHDLKEPLRKIATFSDRLITTQGDELNENARLYLDKIIDSSRRMQSMISDLLSVSVISGNKSFEVKSLEDLLNDAKQTLEYKIEEKNARIISDGLPVMMVVPSQFRQLFLNLLTNSLKFAREGITPEIKITHQYLRPSQVASYDLTKAPRYLKINFADNGIGFDNQFANKIFTIFQRLHGKSEYEGTGIGLAICRKVTENHGGTIIAKGTVNGGSTFTIIIPA